MDNAVTMEDAMVVELVMEHRNQSLGGTVLWMEETPGTTGYHLFITLKTN